MHSTQLVPLAYSVSDACHLASIGKTQLYKLIRSEKIEARRLGCRTLIVGESLRKFLQELPQL